PATPEAKDEGGHQQSSPAGILDLKLVVSGGDCLGYETLPIARVRKPPKAGTAPQLDRAYIPPLLACDAWPVLARDVLQNLHDSFGKRREMLGAQVVSRGITFESRERGDLLILMLLHSVNEADASLQVLAFAEGVHPFPVYLELCRLVGRLALFGDTRQTPELPRYDHDDLGGCF